MWIYETSRRKVNGHTLAMARRNGKEGLFSDGDLGLNAEKTSEGYWAALTHENACILRELLPWTAPSPVLSHEKTLGLGDRLGLAGPGQLEALAGTGVLPVLAQQSIRELNLTHRDYPGVLDAASFAVFRAGWTEGFGADGDHLKTTEQVEYALRSGYTMLTLDCSEYIQADGMAEADEALWQRYAEVPALEGHPIAFTRESLRRAAGVYGRAIDFTQSVYHRYAEGRAPDFELSIDETATPTTPEQHYFVAQELALRGVKLTTLAPRFIGEFQKAVDYQGDLAAFTDQLAAHCAIARHFGYKLSLHSGSDKFSVFPVFGQQTRGNWHVKTAGTHWLKALEVAAQTRPELFRQVYAQALEVFPETTKYYHISANPAVLPAPESLKDGELPDLFASDDARQVLHIAYGPVLERYGKPLYQLWAQEDEGYQALEREHTARHLTALGVRRG